MGEGYWLLVLAPVLGLAGIQLAHLLLAWTIGAGRGFGNLVRGIFGGLLVTGATSVFALHWMAVGWLDALALLVFNLAIFVALSVGYASFIGLCIASLRIRVLQELLATPEGLPRDKLLERYNPRMLIENRIDRLRAGGQIVEREGRFHSGRSGVLAIASVINLMRFVILGKRRP